MRMPEVGDVLEQKYRIDKLLGEGGFGRVVRATTLGTGRLVAVKFLKPRQGGYSTSQARRFLREMRATAQLQCPHTLTLYDFGRTEDGLLYMVCEYIEGRDLLDVLNLRGRLKEPEVVWILYQALQSLAEAHAAGLLHRDIKPGNIRIFKYENDPLRVKLLDFGLAKSLEPGESRLTKTGRVIGTPRYMSPEQLRGLELTPASDIFSLGVVAVEMLLGRESTLLVAGAARVLEIGPDESISAELREVVNDMVAGHPQDRFSTAPQVLQALRPLRSQHTSAPHRAASREQAVAAVHKDFEPTTEDRASPRTTAAERQSRAPAVAAGLAVAVLVAGALVWHLANREADRRPPPRRRALPFVQTEELEPATLVGHDVGVDTPDLPPSPCGSRRGPGVFTMWDDQPVHWQIHVPKTYTGQVEVPLVMLLAEPLNSRPDFLWESGFADLADREGFVVAAPVLADPGHVASWDGEVTRTSMDTLLHELRTEVCVNTEKVYLYADGTAAQKVETATCLDWVAAIVTHHDRPRRVRCERPIPYMHFAPRDSTYLPLTGKRTCLPWVGTPVPLVQHDKLWRETNHCSEKTDVTQEHEHVSCAAYQDCEAPTVSCRTAGGYGWPGSQVRWMHESLCSNEPAPAVFPAAEIAWDFFTSSAPPHCTVETDLVGKLTELDGGHLLYVPETAAQQGHVPLLVALHGDFQTPEMFLNQSALVKHVSQRGVAVLAPSGGTDELPWRTSEQTAFIESLVDDVGRRVCVDPEKLWVLGHGAGGMAADRLSCADWPQAVATTSYRPAVDTTVCDTPKALLRMHPTVSRRMPADGVADPPCNAIPKLSLAEFEQRDQKRNRVTGSGRPWFRHKHGRCVRYDGDATFVSCMLDGGAGYPGGTNDSVLNQVICNDVPADFPATQKVFDFFAPR